MRTTVDIDDELLAEAQRRFPIGTPKTVILEEGLRQLVRGRAGVEHAERRDPRIQRLIDDGRVRARRRADAPPPGVGGPSRETLLEDLARDREDR